MFFAQWWVLDLTSEPLGYARPMRNTDGMHSTHSSVLRNTRNII